MRILYLFTRDWSKEIADYYRGVVPSHRIFGFAELKEMGHEPRNVSAPAPLKRWLEKPIFWRIYQTLAALFAQGRTDCVFAVNEASVLPLLVFKRFGLYRTPVIIFNTGLMHPRNRTGFRKALLDWLLPSAEGLVSQSKMEVESVWKEFGLKQDRQFLIHMLVDTRFFKPDGVVPQGDYCLSVGTNEAKDYPTLLKAFPRDEKLVVVTDAYNAAIIEQHREPGMPVEVYQAVPIQKLKRMYQEAKIVINPLAETDYGSGHTVVLENMVLGRPVIVTKVGGMIDYYEDNVSAISVKPYDVEDMREKIRAYLACPADFAHIGRRAPEWVRGFAAEEFARKLLVVAETVSGVSRPAVPVTPPASRDGNPAAVLNE